MPSKYNDEIWKDVEFSDNIREGQHYKISSFGRIRSFNTRKKRGKILKPGKIRGYAVIGVKQKNNKNTVKYVHKLVAKAFLNKKEDEHFVIHLNYNKSNNRADNLKWVNRIELSRHINRDPLRKYSNSNLTEEKVRLIKKIGANSNRKTTFKEIAKDFGISEMQLYRIRKGECWSYVTID